jgi:general secretion pathway protein K
MHTLLKNLFNLINYALRAGYSIFVHSRSYRPPGWSIRLNLLKCHVLPYLSEKNSLRYRKINSFTTSASPQLYYSENQKGIALVVTLLALILITSLVVEFSYGVYTGTNSLYNWRDSQRLSLMARSGVNVSARFLSDTLSRYDYSYPGTMELPVESPFEDFEGVITVRLEDENSKFNVNSIISSNGVFNETAYNSFKRLLKAISLDEKIADRVADWIDQDSEPMLPGSETGVKNSALISADELLLIPGIDRKDYDKLLPYITVYGDRNAPLININGAEAPVLMSLSDSITEELAKRIIAYRENTPFIEKSKIVYVSGLENTGISLTNKITVKGENFSIKSTAASGGVKRIIETVIDTSSSPAVIRYWKEY